MEHALRRCLLAVRLGEALGLSDPELGEVYYVGLVCSVGCTIKLQGFAHWFQDEIAAAAHAATLDSRSLTDAAMFVLRHVGEADPPLRRAQRVVSAVTFGAPELRRSFVACMRFAGLSVRCWASSQAYNGRSGRCTSAGMAEGSPQGSGARQRLFPHGSPTSREMLTSSTG